MLTTEGCAQRRRRLWDRLDGACEALILGDPQSLIYFANYAPSPFVFRSCDAAAVLVLERERATLVADSMVKAYLAHAHVDEVVAPSEFTAHLHAERGFPRPLAHLPYFMDRVDRDWQQPGPPLHDAATTEQLRELIAKGALSGLVFHTDDVRALYETLQERGVTDFTQEPIDHFYGTDMGLRDPFGNAIRVLERKTAAATA